jgi:hypothetical protein
MSASRMAECITFVVWLDGELGVSFSRDDV